MVRDPRVVATGGSGDMLGCVECGLLPRPPRKKSPEEAESGADNAEEQSDVPYLANLVVAPKGRRQGLGQQLVTATEECARSWGYSELCIKVDRQNFDARRLYDRMGYQLVYLQPTSKGAWIFLQRDI